MSRLACFFAQPHLASPRQEAKTPKCFGSVPLAVVAVPATLARSGPCPAPQAPGAVSGRPLRNLTACAAQSRSAALSAIMPNRILAPWLVALSISQ